jgi:type III restriction enzyme
MPSLAANILNSLPLKSIRRQASISGRSRSFRHRPEARRQTHETLTVEVVEQCLIDDFNILSEQIRRATGTDKGLEGLDLDLPSCKVRFIITVQALREGWDCPFAYVLCSVAEMRSSTAVEQILGRIMRLHQAKRKQRAELNMAPLRAAGRPV